MRVMAVLLTIIGVVFALLGGLLVFGGKIAARNTGGIPLLVGAGLVLMAAGLRRLARRLQARSKVSTSPTGAQVLYLRSFQSDSRESKSEDHRLSRLLFPTALPIATTTHEEQLVKALSRLGAVAAIGAPGEL